MKTSLGSLKKFDSGKPMVSLVEPKFILGIADILTFGAEKYGKNNWKLAKEDDMARYKDALMRHLMSYLDGELLDPESGKPHLHHIGCNLMFLEYFDRQPKTHGLEEFIHEVQYGNAGDV